MRPVRQLVLADGGKRVCARCELAVTFRHRMRGLLGREGLGPDEGLYLRPAPAIHTFFMRFPIDAVFVDSDQRVLSTAEHLRPWRAAGCKGAVAVVELPAGACARRGLAAGDRLVFAETGP